MTFISPGNTAFVLLSAALVMIMTPGLGFFYGGLVGRRNALTILMESFFSLGWVTILWVLFGFSLAFGPDVAGLIGGPKYFFLNHIFEKTTMAAFHGPLYAFVMFQLMFAVITPALITGAFANKMRFKAWIAFLTLWSFLVYFPVAHWLWGGGFLEKWGCEDFAGGIVVHATAGFSALAAALWFGATRKFKNRPHNLMWVALGTALLWFGWFGFNAGSALRAGGDAAIAFTNTQIAAAFAAVTWVLLDAARGGKISATGFCTGAIAGLATVTPTAGYITPQSAMIVGIVAALACYAAVSYKNKKGWDDVLDVWGVHGIGGFTGILLLGIFGTSSVLGENGLLYGNPMFFVKELTAACLCSAYSFAVTLFILWLISRFMEVKIPEEQMEKGIDEIELGEVAYPG
ncbi:MAG: ammonium transporter [Crenarchaeota archaeon]|nr:ammonium transporter [Thermoproteota archaeon]